MLVTNVKELFDSLLHDSIDLTNDKTFSYYRSMTTAHAERMIIALLREGTPYSYNGKILIKLFNGISIISLTSIKTILEQDESGIVWKLEHFVKVKLPFSPKHICNGMYKNRDIRQIDSIHILNHVFTALCRS